MNSGLNAAAHRGHHLLLAAARPEVGRQDQDGVAEVDRAALPVGEPAFVEHLQQHVEHVRVGLFDLVEQHHRVGPPAHRLGQLTALVVADVAGRRTHQASHRVLLAVLAHVDADHRALVVEQEVGQRLGQLGLADAGGAEEQERSGRPVGVGDPGPAAAHRVGHGLHGLPLSDHALAQLVFHPQQLGGLALQQPSGRDAGPGRHHVGDVVGTDLLLEHHVLAGLGLRQRGVELLLHLGDAPVAQLGGLGQVAVALGALGLAAQRLELFLELADDVDRVLLVLPAWRSARPASPCGRPARRAASPAAPWTPRLLPWPAPSLRSPAGAPAARPRRSRPAASRSPSAAGWPPRRPGRWPCPAGTGR